MFVTYSVLLWNKRFVRKISMKNIILILVLSFLSCDYQEDDRFLSTGSNSSSGSSSGPTQGSGEVIVNEVRDVEATTTSVSLNDFNGFFQTYLDRYVVEEPSDQLDTRVDYKKAASDLSVKNEFFKLNNEIEDFIGSDSYQKMEIDEKIAYIINVYNFSVIKVIAENYPIKSIFDINNVFDSKFINFSGNAISLNKLEKEILANLLLEKYGGKTDARLHFALICGAKGCPILSKNVYTKENLELELNEITKAAFQLKDGRILKRTSSSYELVELFDWYDDDFLLHSTKDLPKVSDFYDFINHFIDDESRKLSKEIPFSIPTDYDWSLNSI